MRIHRSRRNSLLFPAGAKSVDIAVVRFRLVLVLGQLGRKNKLFECLHCPKWHATVCWSRCASVQCDVGKFPRSWEALSGHTRSWVRVACEVCGDCDTWDKHSIRHTKPLTLSTTVTMHTYSQLEMTVVHLLENFLFLASYPNDQGR